MEAEVKRLGPRAIPNFKRPEPKRIDEQTLLYPFDPELARLFVDYLRTPSRALWDLYVAKSERLEPLFEEVRDEVAKDDRPWMIDGLAISVEVSRIDRFPAGPLQVRGTVKNALIEGAKARGMTLRLDPDHADLVFTVREVADGLLVAIDLGGQSLHLRGWRLDQGRAPLKETLAAQMLLLSRWDPRAEVLIDPMAGSGTIAAEAALMTVGRRRWVEERRPKLPRVLDVERELPDLFPGTDPSIIAHELHTPQLDPMRDNLMRAGVADLVLQLHGDLRNLTSRRIEATLKQSGRPVHRPGLILTNPPYGIRLGDEEEVERIAVELKDLAERLGYRIAMLAGSKIFERVFGRQPKMKKPMNNGSIPAMFLMYEPKD